MKLNELDADAAEQIYTRLAEPTDQSAFIASCTQFHQFFQAKRLLKKLLYSVRSGNQLLAEKVLESQPERLLEHLGSTTAFQTALGEMDTDMCLMMEQHLKLIPNGYALALAQFDQQHSRDTSQQALSYDFTPLVEAFAAPFDDHISLARETALETFRQHFAPGKGLSSQYLVRSFIQAKRAFDSNKAALLPDCCENDGYLTLVIGYLQAQMPACYIQAAIQGIDRILSGEKLIRSTILTDGEAYPLNDDEPNFRLGYESFIGFISPDVHLPVEDGRPLDDTPWVWKRRGYLSESLASHSLTGFDRLEDLYMSKQAKLATLRQRLHEGAENTMTLTSQAL